MNPTRAYLGAILIAIAGILFWLLLMPAYDRISNEREALAERETILEDHNAIAANLVSLNKQYSDNSASIQRFASIVPAKRSTAELVSTLQALASQNGLTLTSITVSSQTEQANAAAFGVQPIDVGLAGSYLGFRSFISALETNLRIIDIQTVEANPVTAGGASSLGFRIKANAYYLKQ